MITHPYGVDEFDVTSLGPGTINFVEDVGIGAPATLPARSAPGSTRSCAGTPAWSRARTARPTSVTPRPRTRSPAPTLGTNFFRIDGPNIGGTGINTIQTNLFTMQGRVSTNNGVAPTAVTYTRTATTGGFLDVFARSEPNQVIQVSGTGVSSTTLKGDTATDPGVSGNYFGRAAFTGATHRQRSTHQHIGPTSDDSKWSR